MKRLVLAIAFLAVARAASVSGQTAAIEVQQSAGASSESVAGAGTQVRVFGEPVTGLRFEVEGAFGARSGAASDAFGTAYPYEGSHLMEAYADYSLRAGLGLRSVRAGRYRTPFGISAASEHAYVGFTRPPLIRYGEYYALSTGYLEHGVDVVVGVPRLSAEVSVGRPADVGEAIRRPGTDTAVRIEGTLGSLIVGVSGLDTTPYLPATFARGRARFRGIDGRWMRAGVQLRGEWLDGRPFDGVSTTGGYLDLLVHRPGMGPMTALARAERLDYDTIPRFALHTERYEAGLRVRVWQGLSATLGVVHQAGQLTQRRPTAFDASVSYSARKTYGAGAWGAR